MTEPAPNTHTPGLGQVRAAGYVRVSTEEQARHGWNLNADRERIETICRERNWELVRVYDDAGRQGDDPDRPGFRAMLRDLGGVDVIVLRDLDRLSRDLFLYSEAARAFTSAGVEVYDFNGHVDLSSPEGEAMAGVRAVFAQMEKRKIKQRVKQAAEARRRAGKPHGGRRPFGYRYIDKSLVIEATEAATVRRIFDKADSGVSQRAIARELNADGIRTTTGARWEQGSVARILGNVLYIGKVRHRAADDSWEALDGQHEPIIHTDLFERVQTARASAPRRAGGRPLKRGSHLLTRGMLRCGRCGEAMIPINRPERDGQEAYACRGRLSKGPELCDQPSIRRQVIDAALLGELTSRYLDLDATRTRLAERQAGDLAVSREALDQAEREFVAAEAALPKLRRAWRGGVIDDDEFKAQHEEVAAEHEAAQAAVDQARARIAVVEAAGAATDAEEAMLAHLADLKATVAGTVGRAPDLDALRTLIRQMIERVDIGSRAQPYPSDVLDPETCVRPGHDGDSLTVGIYPLSLADADYWLWITPREDAFDFDAAAPRRTIIDVPGSSAAIDEKPTRSTPPTSTTAARAR